MDSQRLQRSTSSVYGARADFAPTAWSSSAEPHLPAREFHKNSLSRIDSVVVQRHGSFRNNDHQVSEHQAHTRWGFERLGTEFRARQ